LCEDVLAAPCVGIVRRASSTKGGGLKLVGATSKSLSHPGGHPFGSTQTKNGKKLTTNLQSFNGEEN
jgi:hypothetical protein